MAGQYTKFKGPVTSTDPGGRAFHRIDIKRKSHETVESAFGELHKVLQNQNKRRKEKVCCDDTFHTGHPLAACLQTPTAFDDTKKETDPVASLLVSTPTEHVLKGDAVAGLLSIGMCNQWSTFF